MGRNEWRDCEVVTNHGDGIVDVKWKENRKLSRRHLAQTSHKEVVDGSDKEAASSEGSETSDVEI